MAQVPKDIQDAILHNILARLKDREALQDLMDMAGGPTLSKADQSCEGAGLGDRLPRYMGKEGCRRGSQTLVQAQ